MSTETNNKKRDFSKISSNEEKVVIEPKLHIDGYTIFKNAVNVSSDVLQEIIMRSHKAGPIFNYNETNSRNDNKRRQVTLNTRNTSKVLKQFLQTINEFVETKLETNNFKQSSWVIIHSRQNCQDQAAHSDYIPDRSLTEASDEQMPLAILVSLMPNTKLNVWPKSIKLATDRNDLILDKINGPIECVVAELDVGDILVFRGDLIHAGSSYSKDNYRLHSYLDSLFVKRTPNRTWVAHLDGTESLKNIILPK